MIVELVNIGGPWKILPPGVYDATLAEVQASFAINPKRVALFKGLLAGAKALHRAGCKVMYLDGSYITEKHNPDDFDACWDPHGVDPKALDPILLDFSERRKKQKQKYGGEFFPSSARADRTHTFIEYFRTDKHTGKEKGIIRLALDRAQMFEVNE